MSDLGFREEQSGPNEPVLSLPTDEARDLRLRDKRSRSASGTYSALPPPVPPRRSYRRLRRPAILFVLTCLSTFWAGATGWLPAFYLTDAAAAEAVIRANWRNGLVYMAAVMGILLMHEMGHFLQTVRYGVPSTLPYFIPFPVAITGTMGAVIGMDGSRGDRKQLFDIGLSGPWAGILVALPIIWFGIKNATPSGALDLGDPLIFKLLTAYLRPDLPDGAALLKHDNPLLMAGWVGMLVTGLNMLPVSQLDGGHVTYALFGRKAGLIARAFVIAAIAFIVIYEQYTWTVMLALVLFLGIDHPPTRDDTAPLGPWRRAIGLVSLAIPIFCFTPMIL